MIWYRSDPYNHWHDKYWLIKESQLVMTIFESPSKSSTAASSKLSTCSCLRAFGRPHPPPHPRRDFCPSSLHPLWMQVGHLYLCLCLYLYFYLYLCLYLYLYLYLYCICGDIGVWYLRGSVGVGTINAPAASPQIPLPALPASPLLHYQSIC